MSSDLDNLLSHFVDKNGICKVCGHDHSFNPTFVAVKLSVDIIPELFSKCSKKYKEVVKEALEQNA
jgi:hypothetical protein